MLTAICGRQVELVSIYYNETDVEYFYYLPPGSELGVSNIFTKPDSVNKIYFYKKFITAPCRKGYRQVGSGGVIGCRKIWYAGKQNQ